MAATEGDHHMPRIRLTIEDNEGKPIENARRTYRLEGDCETLDEIEQAVEEFKKRALPEVERSLLAEAQKRFVANARGEKPPPAASQRH